MKKALITGANRGLGLGFTRYYLENGWHVFAASRSLELADVFNDLGNRFGDRLSPVALDVSDERSIGALRAQLAGTELDLLINNAGISVEENIGSWTGEMFAEIFQINTVGPALVTQAIAPLMSAGAKIVNISSGLASMDLNINPETGLDAYAASKAALNMLTRRLAAKLESREITVNCVDPGWVQTRMGGEQAPLTVDESVGSMTALIEELSLEQSGCFLHSNGEELPW